MEFLFLIFWSRSMVKIGDFTRECWSACFKAFQKSASMFSLTSMGNLLRTSKDRLKRLWKGGIEQSDDRRRKIVFHTLRHTCISLLTERGADTTAVKNYVAHASEEMTKHYTHLSEEYARNEKWSGRADLNGRSGPLTFSRACQESLLIRRDGTLLLSRSRSAIV